MLDGEVVGVALLHLVGVLADVEVQTDTGIDSTVKRELSIYSVELVAHELSLCIHAQANPLGETPDVLEAQATAVTQLISVIIVVQIHGIREVT